MRPTPGARSDRGSAGCVARHRPSAPRADAVGTGPHPDLSDGAPHLVVHDSTGRRVERITKTPYAIGRRQTNDLRLAGAEVSREHAVIVSDGATYRLLDSGSHCGTYVNDVPITEHVLVSGDRIRLGRSGGADLVFSRGDTAGFSNPSSSGSITDFRVLGALLEGLRGLGPGHVLDEVLTLVLDSAITLSDAERGCLLLASPDEALAFTLGRGKGRTTIEAEMFETSRKIPEAAFATGRIQAVEDLQDRELAVEHPATVRIGIRHVLCVPLSVARLGNPSDSVADSKRIGVLYLDSREAGTLLSSTVRSCLDALAIEAAVAIESARLYREEAEKARMDHDMRLAVEIQHMLLPSESISLPFVEAAASSLACRSVGGDFFDYFVQADDCFAFALGDVAGKGPSAALLSAMLQGMLSMAAPGSAEPASVVSRVNAALFGRGIESRFVTLFYGVLDSLGRFTYCNGGHNPPFVFGPSGVQRLNDGGPIVGVFTDIPYRNGTVTLAPGDRIVLFSDGVSEALDCGGEEFGDRRILEILDAVHAESTDMTPTDLVEALVNAVRVFAEGAAQTDDITVMVVRYCGPGGAGSTGC
ncbi:MAG: SpoIIE family protein phosphatase [Acidobacteriota bacterium]|nr:SpoIIE family protein phosphatase [Acidobacteriota bacterium]